MRQKRSKSHAPVAAIVGYTNAGKSTLLNKLTDAGVLQEDKLFATLDPTTRCLELEGEHRFCSPIRLDLSASCPTTIEAFRSTLEEAKYADVILHVVDAASAQMEQQMFVVYDTLANLGVTDKTVVTLFNKQDKILEKETLRDFKADYTLEISAKTGEGLNALKMVLEKILQDKNILIERVYPYDKAGLIQLIRRHGQLFGGGVQAGRNLCKKPLCQWKFIPMLHFNMSV